MYFLLDSLTSNTKSQYLGPYGNILLLKIQLKHEVTTCAIEVIFSLTSATWFCNRSDCNRNNDFTVFTSFCYKLSSTDLHYVVAIQWRNFIYK